MSCEYWNITSQSYYAISCNNKQGSPNLVTGQVAFSDYGYIVTPWTAYTFIGLFGAAALLQTLLALVTQHWWTLVIVAGTLVETAGWGGRLWSVQTWVWEFNYGGTWFDNHNAYIMQICCLVIAPVFYSAANYLWLGKLMQKSRKMYCSLTPKFFAVTFMSCDWVCLLIQAGGGGWAGTAETPQQANEGARLMSAGVMLQLIVTLAFTALYLEYLIRYSLDRPVRRQLAKVRLWTRKHNSLAEWSEDSEAEDPSTVGMQHRRGTPIKSMRPGWLENDSWRSERLSNRARITTMCVIACTTLLIIARSIYRSKELLNGWTSPLALNQTVFLVCDAMLMTIVAYLFVFFHPGLLLGRKHWSK